MADVELLEQTLIKHEDSDIVHVSNICSHLFVQDSLPAIIPTLGNQATKFVLDAVLTSIIFYAKLISKDLPYCNSTVQNMFHIMHE